MPTSTSASLAPLACPPITISPAVLTDSLTVTVSGTNTTSLSGSVEVDSGGWGAKTLATPVGPGASWSISYTVPDDATIGRHTIQAWLIPMAPAQPAVAGRSLATTRGGDPTHAVSLPFTRLGTGLASGEPDLEAGVRAKLYKAPLGCGDLELPPGSATVTGTVVDASTTAGLGNANVQLIAVPSYASGLPQSPFERLMLSNQIATRATSLPDCAASRSVGSPMLEPAALQMLQAATGRYNAAVSVAQTGSTGPGLTLPNEMRNAARLPKPALELNQVAGSLSPAPTGGPIVAGSTGAFGLLNVGLLVSDGSFSKSVPAPASYYVVITLAGYESYIGTVKYTARRFATIDLGAIALTPYSDTTAPVMSCAPSRYFLSFPDGQLPVRVHFVAGQPANVPLLVTGMDFQVDGGAIVPGYAVDGGWAADIDVSPANPGKRCVGARPRYANGVEGDFGNDPSTCATSLVLLDTPGWVGQGWAVNQQLTWNAGDWRYEFSYTIPGAAFNVQNNFPAQSILGVTVVPGLTNKAAMGITLNETFTPAERQSAASGWVGSGQSEFALTILNRNLVEKLLAKANLPTTSCTSSGCPLPITTTLKSPWPQLDALYQNGEPSYGWTSGNASFTIIDDYELANVPLGNYYGVVTLRFTVTFGMDGTATISGSVDPSGVPLGVTVTQTPGITFTISPALEVDVLSGLLGTGSGGADLVVGLEIPITYTDPPQEFDATYCLYLSANIWARYVINYYFSSYDTGKIYPLDPYTTDYQTGCHVFQGPLPVYASVDGERAAPANLFAYRPGADIGGGLTRETVAEAQPRDRSGPVTVALAPPPAQSGDDALPFYAAPRLVSDGAGQSMLLWTNLSSPLASDGPQYPAVVFVAAGDVSRDGVPPAQVLGDFTKGGSDPSVAYLGPNRAIAAWTQGPSVVKDESIGARLESAIAAGQTAELSALIRELMSGNEINYSLWDGQRWTPSANLTRDSFADGASVLAADPTTGRAVLLWVKDTSTSTDQRTRQAIWWAAWDGKAFTKPAELYASRGQSYQPAIAYRNGVAVATWVEDQDGDMGTTRDARLMMATFQKEAWQGIGPLVGTPGGASSPSIALDTEGNPLIAFIALAEGNHAQVNGTPYAAYLRGGKLSSLSQLSTLPGEQPQVVLTPDGQALVFYKVLNGSAVGVQSGSGTGGDVHRSSSSFQRGPGFPDSQHGAASIAATGAMLRAGQLNWSSPLVVAQKDGSNWTSFAVALIDPRTVMIVAADAYATRAANDNIAPDRVDFVRVPYIASPVAEAVTLTGSGAPAGQQASARATVANLGFAPLGPGTSVTFYLDQPGDPSYRIGQASLAAPAAFASEQTASVQFTSDGRQHQVYAVVTAAGVAPQPGQYDAVAVVNPLPVPTNLRAGGNPAGSGLLLNWNVGVFDPTVTYSVWRSASQSGPYVEVGTSDVPAYLDRDVAPGVTYYYRVATVIPSGQNSTLSNVATASPADGSQGPPRS
ncbi:MAG: hypothetical protein HYX52_06305 [Chloroflexi bacterium]|nr:hypothetical protein [Chloroflexota bacterium]